MTATKEKKKNIKTDIGTFNDKIILNILSHLSDPRDLCMASTLSPSWKRVSQDPNLWTNSNMGFFGMDGELEFWKTFCKLP
jgi:hypothetical protein